MRCRVYRKEEKREGRKEGEKCVLVCGAYVALRVSVAIPSVVSRVRLYGLVKKCSVSSGLSSERSRTPASAALRKAI